MGDKRKTCYICFKPIDEFEACGWRPYFGDFHKECFLRKSAHPDAVAKIAFFRFDMSSGAFLLEIFLWMQVLSVLALFFIFASIAARVGDFNLLLIVDAVTLILLSGVVPILYNRHKNTSEMKKHGLQGHVLGPDEF